MPGRRQFDQAVLNELRTGKIIGLRAGQAPHRFIGLWMVVVENRLFVRSWALAERSWWRVLQADPVAVLQVGQKELDVRAVRTRSERLKDAVSQAYREKYHTPGSLKYARDLARKRSRDTTTELVPTR